MEYLIGVILALAVAGFATLSGFDRGRSFYPTVVMVVAAYYVLFAVMGGSRNALGMEIAVASGFALLAVLGFKRNLWLVAAALAGHGVFDFRPSPVHRQPWSAELVAWVLRGVRRDCRWVAGDASVHAVAEPGRIADL